MGKPKVVTDAGPLIYLALLKRFHLLHDLFDEVWVPEAVHHEVVRQGRNMPGASETEVAVWTGRFRSAKASDVIAVDNLLTELDRGEAEAIVVARELNIGPSWEMGDGGREAAGLIPGEGHLRARAVARAVRFAGHGQDGYTG